MEVERGTEGPEKKMRRISPERLLIERFDELSEETSGFAARAGVAVHSSSWTPMACPEERNLRCRNFLNKWHHPHT